MAKLPEQMLSDQIRREIAEIVETTVRETVRELRKTGLLKRADDVAYNEVSARLYDYYEHPERDGEMKGALAQISGDAYFRILPEFYRDHIPVGYIAESFPGNTSETTIWRNKKRLCLKLYKLLQ